MRNEINKLLTLIMISVFFVGCNQGNNDIKMKAKGGAVPSGGQNHSQKGDNSEGDNEEESDLDEMSSSSEGVGGNEQSDSIKNNSDEKQQQSEAGTKSPVEYKRL